MTSADRSGFEEFDRVLALVRSTRLVLDALLLDGELPAGGSAFLADATLPHVEAIEAGLRGWLRADMAGLAELRYLVGRIAEARVGPPQTEAEAEAARVEAVTDQVRLAELGSRLTPADPRALAALAHARLVFAFLPRVPAAEVRFPAGRPSYADIPSPRGPAELIERIEELEREVWRIARGMPVRPVDPAIRRTYGFFDAAERLDERTFPPAA
ncbi:MAG: hypothetical protein QOF11_2116 [Chloroflexota bacterium]|nr:hypothetical protein [Chloroflexota bacterium]